MSQRLRPLALSLRALGKVAAGPVHAPARVARALTTRRGLHASASTRASGFGMRGPDGARETPSGAYQSVFGDAAAERATAPEVLERMKDHLDTLFGLDFPPDLARRILTHASHGDAPRGNNQRLSFIGRRVLESYFLLFLHSARLPANAHPDYAALAERNVNTYVFGEHVGNAWKLGRVARWAPLGKANSAAGRTQGLYKVSGTAIEALVGGVYHQFGATVAHRLFHTRILPFLPHLPPVFAQHATQICENLGGQDAPLLVDAKPAGAPATKVESTRLSLAAATSVIPSKATTSKVTPGVGVAGLSRERQTDRVQREKLAL